MAATTNYVRADREVGDEARMYSEEVRERAMLARASHAKSRRPSKPKIYQFTQKEWQKMNGPVSTYNINAPMSWAEFRKLPVDIRKHYVISIMDKYGVGISPLARMFGVTHATVAAFIHQHEIRVPAYRKADGARFLSEFVNKTTPDSEAAPITEEPVEVETETIPANATSVVAQPKANTMSVVAASLLFEGEFNTQIISDALNRVVPQGSCVKISIQVESR